MEVKAGDIVDVRCTVKTDGSLSDSSIAVKIGAATAYPPSDTVKLVREYVPNGHLCSVEGHVGGWRLMHVIAETAWVKNTDTGAERLVPVDQTRRWRGKQPD